MLLGRVIDRVLDPMLIFIRLNRLFPVSINQYYEYPLHHTTYIHYTYHLTGIFHFTGW